MALNQSFQYGPIIKLPLQILLSMHDQRLLQVDQSDNFDTAFSQSFKNFAFKMVTLLLGHIGMLIP